MPDRKVWTVQIQVDRGFEEAYSKKPENFTNDEIQMMGELAQALYENLEKFGYTRMQICEGGGNILA